MAHPDNADAYLNLGAALRARGKLDEAVKAYYEAIRIMPDFAEAHSNLGNALLGQGKVGDALLSCDRALSSRPDFAEASNNRGLALHELKRYDEALASYDHALSIRPDHVAACYNRGRGLHDLKRLDEALASYDRVLSLQPAAPDALYHRSVTLHELKRYDEALANYDRALSLRPGHTDALHNRRITLIEQMRLDQSLATHGWARTPDTVNLYFNCNIIVNEQMRCEEALTATRNLLIVHTPGAQSLSDWLEIKRRIEKRTRDIDVRIAVNGAANSVIRRWQAKRPSLVFSSFRLMHYRPTGGTVYAGRHISKFEQIERLANLGLPVPLTAKLTRNIALNPSDWGRYVVVKPSHGEMAQGVRLLRTVDVATRYNELIPLPDQNDLAM